MAEQHLNMGDITISAEEWNAALQESGENTPGIGDADRTVSNNQPADTQESDPSAPEPADVPRVRAWIQDTTDSTDSQPSAGNVAVSNPSDQRTETDMSTTNVNDTVGPGTSGPVNANQTGAYSWGDAGAVAAVVAALAIGAVALGGD